MSHLVWALDKHWSCPIHKESVTMFADDPWDEEGEICLDCLTGKWVATKDKEGWATLNFRSKGTWDYINDRFFEELIAAVNRPVFGNLQGKKAVIEWPS